MLGGDAAGVGRARTMAVFASSWPVRHADEAPVADDGELVAVGPARASLGRNAAQRAARLPWLSISPPHQNVGEVGNSSSGQSRDRASGGLPWSQEKAQRSRTSGSIDDRQRQHVAR